ncbi:hypothetical protein YC2023_076618 [Brassica napus]
MAGLKAGHCSSTVQVRLLRFWEAWNINGFSDEIHKVCLHCLRIHQMLLRSSLLQVCFSYWFKFHKIVPLNAVMYLELKTMALLKK